MRILVVQNPHASRGSKARAQRVMTRLRRQNADARLVRTPSLADLSDVLTRAQQYDVISALGGDGSVRALVQAWPGGEAALGVIPGGGADYIARSLGAPRSPDAAADVLVAGETAHVVVGAAGPARFLLMAGVGLDGAAASRVWPALKRVHAASSYGVAIGVEAARFLQNAPQLELSVDGVWCQAPWVMLTNARLADGPFVRPAGEFGASPKLHVILAKPRGPLDVVRILRQLATGALRPRPPMLEIRACRRVEVRGPVGLPVHADGECVGTTPITLEAQGVVPVRVSKRFV